MTVGYVCVHLYLHLSITFLSVCGYDCVCISVCLCVSVCVYCSSLCVRVCEWESMCMSVSLYVTCDENACVCMSVYE